jgi:ubiquinone biosynthesis protein COQ4
MQTTVTGGRPQPNKPYALREAGQAVRALMRDPNDVSQVFRIINALPGHAFERVVRRMKQSETGREILRGRPELMAKLADRDYLAALPDGTLGREYLRFMDAESLTPGALVDADATAGWDADQHSRELAFARRWLRDTHDLWHVVTGYQGDLLGEPALVAFQCVQNCWHPGFAFISFMVFMRGGIFPGMRRIVLEGFWRAIRSGWFPGADWVAMLPQPLTEVRRQLQVAPLTPYKPLRVTDLPGGKLPAV